MAAIGPFGYQREAVRVKVMVSRSCSLYLA